MEKRRFKGIQKLRETYIRKKSKMRPNSGPKSNNRFWDSKVFRNDNVVIPIETRDKWTTITFAEKANFCDCDCE